MKKTQIKKKYEKEESRHEKAYEKENSRHEKKHKEELNTALNTGCKKKKKK